MKWLSTAGLLIGAVAIAVGVSGCGRSGPQQESAAAAESAATPVMVATAMRGSIEDTLELTGSAQANDEVDVVSEVSGKVTRVYADVGDYVRRGQTLVRLDTQMASAQRGQAAASVRAAQASLAQARTARDLTDEQTVIAVRLAEAQLAAAREQLKKAEKAAELTRSTVENNIEQAKTGVQSAETSLAEIRAGAREQQLRQAQAAVAQAKSSLDLARSTYERNKSLFDAGVIAQQQLDQVRTQYEVAQAQYEQAVQAQSLTVEGARTEQVRQAELGVQAARDRLRLAEVARDQIDISQRDVAAVREGVRQAEEGLAAARANRAQVQVSDRQIQAAEAMVGQASSAEQVTSVQVAKHSISAPVSGLVARRMVDRGEGAMPGVPVMRLVDINPIRVEAVINELDVDRVRLGDRGVVTVDGLPDDQFLGTVKDIAPQASQNTRNFLVRLDVDNATGAIRPGMFARVQLVLASRSDSILITRDGLVESGDKRLVYVVENGQMSVREVTVGAISGNMVEVVQGLREGDSYVVTAQSTLAEGQKVEPKPRSSINVDEPGAAQAAQQNPATP